jgi:hypothetical protein
MNELLKLKLDMVYREIPMEEAQRRFEELKPQPPVEAPAEAPAPPVEKPVRKRKVVKPLLPKSK